MLLSNKGGIGGEEEEEEKEKGGRASWWRFAGSAWQTGREMGKQGAGGDWTRGRGRVGEGEWSETENTCPSF